jgi:hypothetical protein
VIGALLSAYLPNDLDASKTVVGGRMGLTEEGLFAGSLPTGDFPRGTIGKPAARLHGGA